MNQQSTLKKAESLLASLEKHGQSDYIGETISQLEHCLQAAHQAQKTGKFRLRDECTCHFQNIITKQT